MKKPTSKPDLDLVGIDGNAFNIMGLTMLSLKRAGADKEYVDQYFVDARKGDYDNLLVVTMRYLDDYE